jgi:hypothetical protein
MLEFLVIESVRRGRDYQLSRAFRLPFGATGGSFGTDYSVTSPPSLCRFHNSNERSSLLGKDLRR